jgi:DNA end-binding protein Ku
MRPELLSQTRTLIANLEETMSAQPLATEPVSPSATALASSASTRGRASWSGLLKLSLVAIPIKAYPAASTSQQVHFNQLHAGCGQRIRYEKHCSVHGKVEAGAIVSGYAYAPEQYVVIDQAELEPLRPPQERALCLERFLDPQQLDPALFSGRTLFLAPDGLAAQHAYAVLTQALSTRGKWAVGRVMLGGHRVVALVRPVGLILALHVLHFPEQLRSAEALTPLSRAEPATPEEQHLAGMLIDAASQPVCWPDYRDDSGEQLRTLIQAKLHGRSVAAPVAEDIPILQLVDALKRSVAQALQESPAQESGDRARVNQPVAAAPSGLQETNKPSRKPTRRRSA